MRSFELNKLVRDKIFVSMRKMGQEPEARYLEGDELIAELKRKAAEEAKEFDRSDPDKVLDELADQLEVALARIALGDASAEGHPSQLERQAVKLGISPDELRARRALLREQRGGFDGGIFVGRLDLQDDDVYVAYYSSDPVRFPEVTDV